MKKYKKIISIFILIITLISTLQNIVMAAMPLNKANLKSEHALKINVEFFNGNWGPMIGDYICYTANGKKYPAYCISHGLDGVDERGSYTVDISELLDDNRIWRVIINGYPYQTPAAMGVDSVDDAYFATKQAIHCVLLNTNIDEYYRGKNSSGKKVVEAIKRLKNIGLNGTQTPQSANLRINKSGSIIEDGNYYSQKYTVTSAVVTSQFQVTGLAGFPEGSFIANNNGKPQILFNAEETFKVMIPKAKFTSNINGVISVSSKCKTYPIMYGKTRIPGTQDYAITYDPYADFSAHTNLNVTTNTGKVQVKKIDSENSKPIEGVTFQLLKPDGTQVATAKTDSQGIAVFSNLYQGNYKLREINTNKEYILNSEVFDITVEYNKTTTKTITNYHKKGNLKINKTDKDTSEPVEGVTFQLLDTNGKIVASGATNNKGELSFNNLRTGKYRLKETRNKS